MTQQNKTMNFLIHDANGKWKLEAAGARQRAHSAHASFSRLLSPPSPCFCLTYPSRRASSNKSHGAWRPPSALRLPPTAFRLPPSASLLRLDRQDHQDCRSSRNSECLRSLSQRKNSSVRFVRKRRSRLSPVPADSRIFPPNLPFPPAFYIMIFLPFLLCLDKNGNTRVQW